jgi:peptide/nickel transport system permease protein
LSAEPSLIAPVLPDAGRPNANALRRLVRNPAVLIGGTVLLVMALMGLLAPFLGTIDPAAINPSARNRVPGVERSIRADDGSTTVFKHRMGTDSLGRDVYSRVVYGARVSLMIAVSVAAVSISIGLILGLVAGYIRPLDAVIMRFMDGLMAIPAILLAIAVVSLFRAGLTAVIVAIIVPEIPRVVRLVRSIVLSVREEPYVEAAIMQGTRLPLLMVRHILPNTIAPLIVQGTFIAASAMMLPQVGVSGGMPMPRKDRIASTRIAEAAMNVPWTISGAMVLGRMWRTISSGSLVPCMIAAST